MYPLEYSTESIPKNSTHRIIFLTKIVIFCFLIIVLKLFYLQILKGNHFYKISVQNSTELFIEMAPRGVIFDCKNRVLCKNKPVIQVVFYPFLRKNKITVEEINKLKKILNIKNLENKILSSYNSLTAVGLAENIPLETALKLFEQIHNLGGIYVNTEQNRYYPYKEIASQTIGYLGEINTNELSVMVDKGYKKGDKIGKSGLEKEYDIYLRGKDGGWLIESDASGKQLNILERILPEKGNDLYTTIDIDLQTKAEELFSKNKYYGAIVGLDPKNNAVRILVSSPGYDPNKFILKLPERMDYITNQNLPMYNRAIQAQYPPGSAFKIITSLCALNEGKIEPSQKFYCPGYFMLGNKVFKCWEHTGHGEVSFLKGVEKSCDVYFYNVGLKTGKDLILKYADMFGFGKITGIDLPYEKPGFIFTPELLKTEKKYWYDGDTVNIAIGQGYIDVTPLQMAVMISAVANKGNIFQPYLVEKIVNKNGEIIYLHKTKKINTLDIKKDVWDLLEQGLISVVETGTGQMAKINGLKIAGKTGTAQNPHGKDHAWFICYAPVENPEIALAVLVEHKGMGGSIAAPIAREILYERFRN